MRRPVFLALAGLLAACGGASGASMLDLRHDAGGASEAAPPEAAADDAAATPEVSLEEASPADVGTLDALDVDGGEVSAVDSGPTCWHYTDAGHLTMSCDDGVGCTVDSCGTDGGCQHVASNALCPANENCSAVSGCQCPGCLTAGACAAGMSDLACGTGGISCIDCATSAQACLNGACQ